ncbi:MAG: hypothetical protein AYL28_004070 [Candidatus Bathyarchaeota archaeon B23]|nr:MAG: hypothetical protein AYL28_004070 [Candidatus Bathyarchaeota archaeon B23]
MKKIKQEIPDIILCGAIPAQKTEIIERNPITGKIYGEDETWEMALDPGKWGIDLSKEELQEKIGEKLGWDYKTEARYPDITNPEFQELLLSWAKKQIDLGIDAIWIDLLFKQAVFFYRITGDPHHQAVKESYEAACKIVDEIHRYGQLRGRYIYVGSWATPILLPYDAPDLDFVTYVPTSEEVFNRRFDEDGWDEAVEEIRRGFGDVLILAFLDSGPTVRSPLGVFSQNLTSTEQREFLRLADEFLQERGVVFAYPVHGMWMGDEATILSYRKSRMYDSLAPEFETYETIRELAQRKGGG